MGVTRSSLVCDRVRAQISLGLDGELSQLESAMVGSHLERCAECQAYEAEVTAFTQALRSSPLEPIDRTIVVRRPRRPALRARAQVAAAAALALASLAGAGHFLHGGSSELEPVFLPARAHITKMPSKRQLEREQLILERARPGHPTPIDGRAL
jgi:anti-sigma factor RsiW